MAQFLVTGRSGIGKSTICEEFQNQSYIAFDADDIDGLPQWQDRLTGLPVEVDISGFVDESVVNWNWQRNAMEKLMADNHDFFLCGGAGNQLKYYDMFDRVYQLDLPPADHRARLLGRTTHRYARDPVMIESKIAQQELLKQESIKLGAVVIDAAQSPEKIVRAILDDVNRGNRR